MEQARRVGGTVSRLPRRPGGLGAAIERQRRGEQTAALALFERHVAERPQDVEGWILLAQAQRRCQQVDAALLSLQRALRLAPRDAAIWSNLGDVWMQLGHAEQGLRSHRRAVELAPARIDLSLHCAVALRCLQRFAEAERLLDACLTREPGRADLRYEYALLCLLTGRWRDAWPGYSCRPGRPPGALPARVPRWAGECIGARHLLMFSDSGVGETLWASRYVPLLAHRGAMLSLVAPANVHPLLAALPVRLLSPTDVRLNEDRFDYLAPLSELPWLVDPRGVTIPEPTSLRVDAEVPEVLAPGADPSELRVGVAWDSTPATVGAFNALPAADRFAQLALLPGVRVVSLQLDESVCAEGIADPDSGGCGLDPSTLAAVIGSLDVVLTADEQVAHLAGCLGKPVLNLLPFTPRWIWGVRGDTSPWYPAMRLLRQARPGAWDAVFSEAHALIRGWARVRQRDAARARRAAAKEARAAWF